MRVFGIVEFWDYGQCWRDEEVSCLFWFWCWILWTREIRDQTFIEKEDTVIIKVVSCYPEKIRTKLICKGGDTIKSIEVIPPEKPPKPPPKPPPTPPQKPPPTPPPPPPVPAYPVFFYPIGVCCKSCSGGRGGGSCHHGCRIPHQPPSYDVWVSGCRCDRSYGCRCEFLIEENPTCTIMWIILRRDCRCLVCLVPLLSWVLSRWSVLFGYFLVHNIKVV